MEKEDLISIQSAAEKDMDPRTDLAVERTLLAWERTQLAWLRTTLSLLGAGIALDKGLEAIHKSRISTGNALFENAHILGIFLSISGTVLMLINTFLYIRRYKSLSQMTTIKSITIPPGALASIIIIVLGIAISFLLLVS